MSSFAAHILVSTLRSRLLAGGVVAGFLAVTLIPSFSVAAPVEDSIPQLGSRFCGWGAPAPDREREGSDLETLGRGADAGNERRGAERQEAASLYLPIALLAWGRAWPTPFSPTRVFPPDAERSLDDMGARSFRAPHLSHRQAFGKCEAVLVRRIHRPLRGRGDAGGRYDRTRGRQLSLHRILPHPAHREAR